MGPFLRHMAVVSGGAKYVASILGDVAKGRMPGVTFTADTRTINLRLLDALSCLAKPSV